MKRMGKSMVLLLPNKYFIFFAGLGIPLKSVIFLSGICCVDSSLLVHGKIDRVFRSGQRKTPSKLQNFFFLQELCH
jgi:hypothetical protein